MTLAPVGTESIKISQTNEGEAVTVFLAGIVNVQTGAVCPLPPTIIFRSQAKTSETSRILREVKVLSTSLSSKVYADVTETGWMRQPVLEKILTRYIDSINDSKLPTALIVDDHTTHQTTSVPVNCDMHRIPGGYTSLIQVHDRFLNFHFKRFYDEELKIWRAFSKSRERIEKGQWILFWSAHDKTWATYHSQMRNAVHRYIIDPMMVYP